MPDTASAEMPSTTEDDWFDIIWAQKMFLQTHIMQTVKIIK